MHHYALELRIKEPKGLSTLNGTKYIPLHYSFRRCVYVLVCVLSLFTIVTCWEYKLWMGHVATYSGSISFHRCHHCLVDKDRRTEGAAPHTDICQPSIGEKHV